MKRQGRDLSANRIARQSKPHDGRVASVSANIRNGPAFRQHKKSAVSSQTLSCGLVNACRFVPLLPNFILHAFFHSKFLIQSFAGANLNSNHIGHRAVSNNYCTMDETVTKLTEILGNDLFNDITSPDLELTNTADIRCQCDTLILRPNSAKLIVPTDAMLAVERELSCSQTADGLFKRIVRGCYWLVDDMYKFEHMGYTKELNAQNLPNQTTSTLLSGLRYLACAECNLCPLGWFDPTTKESYLHVWPIKKQPTT